MDIGGEYLPVQNRIRRKMEGKPTIQLSGKAVGTVIVGIIGALGLGVVYDYGLGYDDSRHSGWPGGHCRPAVLDSHGRGSEISRILPVWEALHS